MKQTLREEIQAQHDALYFMVDNRLNEIDAQLDYLKKLADGNRDDLATCVDLGLRIEGRMK